MKRKGSHQQTVRIPGIGRIVVGPDQVLSKPGKVSPKKFIESFRKARKQQIFPPTAHVAA